MSNVTHHTSHVPCRPSAFTLIEILLYVGIVATVITFTTIFAFDLSRNATLELQREQEQFELLFVMERLTREIQASAGIVGSQSLFGVHPSRLALGSASGGTDFVEFVGATNSIRIVRSGGAIETLTTSALPITSFVIANRSEVKRPAVITLTLQSRNSLAPLSTSLSLRSSLPVL